MGIDDMDAPALQEEPSDLPPAHVPVPMPAMLHADAPAELDDGAAVFNDVPAHDFDDVPAYDFGDAHPENDDGDAPQVPGRPQRVTYQPAVFSPTQFDEAHQHDRRHQREQANTSTWCSSLQEEFRTQVTHPAHLAAAPTTSASPAARAHALEYALHSDASTYADPTTLAEAMASPDRAEWLIALKAELRAHRINQTWVYSRLPHGRRAIPSKWVFKTKRDADGVIVRYKVRLVARGDRQVQGFDYDETFSPTLRFDTFRYLCALCVRLRRDHPELAYVLHQMDVVTAYLNGKLLEPVYMLPPTGTAGVPDGQVLKLLRSLYGLKNAGRLWHQDFDATLRRAGFEQSTADPCLYIRRAPGRAMAVIAI